MTKTLNKHLGFKFRLSKTLNGNVTASATRDYRAWANKELGAPQDDDTLYVRLVYHASLNSIEVRHRRTKAEGFQKLNFGSTDQRPTASAGWSDSPHLRAVPVFKAFDTKARPRGVRLEGDELVYLIPLDGRIEGDSSRRSPEERTEIAVPPQPQLKAEELAPSKHVLVPLGDSVICLDLSKAERVELLGKFADKIVED